MQNVTSTFVIALVLVVIVSAAQADEQKPLFVRDANEALPPQALQYQDPLPGFEWDTYLRDRMIVLPTEYSVDQILQKKSAIFQGEVIVDDFQVNEEVIPGFSRQLHPDVGVNRNGGYVVVWWDERNGGPDIYAQLYDSTGHPVGTNFRVNDDPLRCAVRQGSPSVAVSSRGDFIVTWQDKRNGDYDIYAQRYDPDGNSLGGNFRVCDDTGTTYQNQPTLAMTSDGSFVIVWQDKRQDGWLGDIYAQYFDQNGNPQGPNFKVNDDPPGSGQKDVSVGMAEDGAFVVVWSDERNGQGNSHIYAQRYYPQGWPIGTNFKVNDGSLYAFEPKDPSIAVASDGFFVIAWSEECLEGGCYRRISAQRFDANGHRLGSNFQVSTWPFWSYNTSVGIASNGAFTVTWENGPETFWPPLSQDSDVYAQCYNSDGNPVGDNFKINDDTTDMMQIYPAIGIAPDGAFVVAWDDNRTDNLDIYTQRFDNNGTPLGTNFMVNEDAGTNQDWPVIGACASGDFVIVWEDDRRTTYNDIYAQRFDAAGNPVGSNFKVNEDTTVDWHFEPSVGMASNGTFVITWFDERESVFCDDIIHVFAQRYDADGNALGPNLKVSEDTDIDIHFFPNTSVAPNGTFVIAWEDLREDLIYNIYAQRYDADGNPLGANFRVNDDTDIFQQRSPSVGMAADGSFVISWWDNRNQGNGFDIYAQCYNSEGNPLGSNFKVNDDGTYSDRWYPSTGVFPEGAFVITWEDYRNGDSDIYAQQFNSEGIPLNANFRVDGDTANTEQYYPKVAVSSDGSFMIAWTDFRNGYCDGDVYAQRYNAEGIPLDGNFRVNSNVKWTYQGNPDIALDANSNMYFCWMDTRIPGQGYNIFAKVLGWEETSTTPESSPASPRSYFLAQNYPNPFNAMTDIGYQIPDGRSPAHTSLKIYNVLGQEVRTLLDERQDAGYCSVSWDGRDDRGNNVASGVYSYRLSMNGGEWVKVRKMVLVR